jgi:tetratricopeptide (TPR) repeat protein
VDPLPGDPASQAAARARVVRELQALLAADPLFSPLPELILERQRALGEGGMGVVQLVLDRRLGRLAALKTIKGEGEDRLVRRFLREAKVTARLDHPGIPPVYDAGRTAGGQHFMLLRFVDGQSLTERIRAGAPRGELLGILVKVCEAVAYAHSRRIVHRDLKPDNVMVGAFGEVLVMDWGIARDLSESRTLDAAALTTGDFAAGDAPGRSAGDGLTSQGALLGTLGYVPAEQARGEDVDERADIFALGAILCEALAGRPPIQAASRLEAIRMTLDGEVELPRAADAAVPPELDAIAAKALALAPDDRYQRATELAADLRAWLEGRPVSVFRYGRARRLARLARQHPTEVASVGGALVLALAAAGVFAVQNVEIRKSRDATLATSQKLETTLAALEKEGRERHAAEAERSAVERSRALLAEARSRSRQGAVREEVERLVGEAVLLRRNEVVLLEAGRLLTEAGAVDAGRRLLRAAADEFPPGYAALFSLHELDQAGSGGAGFFSEPLRELVTRARARGEENEFTDLAAATECGEKDDWAAALAHCDGALAKAPRFAPAWGVRAWVRLNRHDVDGALADAEKMVDLDATNFYGWHQRGLARWRHHDVAGAIADLDRAIQLAPRSAESWCDRGIIRVDANDVDGAVVDFDRAVELAPASPALLTNRVTAWLRRGDLVRARADNEKAIALDSKRPVVWLNQGVILMRQGDASGARAAYDKAIELGPLLGGAWTARAMFRDQVGDGAGAFTDLTRSLELDPSSSRAWALRGQLRVKKGDLEGAIADHSHAIELAPLYSDAWSGRGYARELARDPGARADYDRAIELDALNAPALVNRSHCRWTSGDLAGGLADLDRALALERSEQAFSNRGAIRERLHDFDGALSDFRAALEMSPGNGLSHLNVAVALVAMGDLDAGIRECDAAIERDPGCVAAWHERGYARGRKGDLEGGTADFEHALGLGPPTAELLAGFVQVLVERKDLARAATLVARAFALEPEGASSHGARARLRLAQGDAAGAIEDATRALPGDFPCLTLELRADARLALGDRALARADLEAARKALYERDPRRAVLEKRIAELSR